MLSRRKVLLELTSLSLWLGASGTFAQMFNPKVDYPTGTGAYCVACADFDGDLDQDIAVANYATVGSVSILENDDNGIFLAKVDYPVGSLPTGIFSADFDGDGDYDLAVANAGGSTVSILMNNGDGTFQEP